MYWKICPKALRIMEKFGGMEIKKNRTELYEFPFNALGFRTGLK